MTSLPPNDFYSADLSRVHHYGFGAFARNAAPGLLQIFRDRGVHGGLVVDLGCGSGIWAAELIRAGFDVLGVDVSSAMLEIARTVAPGATFALASIHHLEVPPCAAVTALGEPLSYIVDREPDLPGLFARVHQALAPGGLLVFDLVTSDPAAAPMQYERTIEGSDWRVETVVEEDSERALVTRRIRTFRGNPNDRGEGTVELHRVRTYLPDRVIAELERCGFRVETTDSYGSLRLAPRRLAFVAQK